MAPDNEPTCTRLKSSRGDWLVHPDLRRALIADAAEQGISLNEVIVKILCAKYGVEFEPTPRKTDPALDGDVLQVRRPDSLVKAMDRKVPHSQSTPDAIRMTLSAHYGLAVPAKPRYTRRRAKTA